MARLLSIVTIVRNDLSGLRSTLASLPSMPNIEYIIIDGSDDQSHYELFSTFAASWSFRSIYKRQTSNGLFQAMNEGLDLSSGTWTIFMNSGDYFVTDAEYKLNSFLNKYSSNQDICSVIFASVLRSSMQTYIGVNPPFLPTDPRVHSLLITSLPSLFWPCHQSICFRTSVHKKLPYNPFTIGSDQSIISIFLRQPHVFTSSALAIVDTGGISSHGPSSLSSLRAQSKSAFKQGQYRRIFRLILKTILNFLGLSSVTSLIRFMRYKLIVPILYIIPHTPVS